jgi:ParB/RepB/Spo0J family partition protein
VIIVSSIPINRIRIPPYHIREEYRGIEELAESLKKRRVYPIVVRPVEGGFYELVAGARRLKAYQLMGKTELKVGDEVVVRDYGDRDALLVSGIENLQRDDLSNYEKGRWVKMMMEKYGYTYKDLHEETGIPISTLESWKIAYEGFEELKRKEEEALKKAGKAPSIVTIPEVKPPAEVLRRVRSIVPDRFHEVMRVAAERGLTQTQAVELARRLEREPQRKVEEVAEEVKGVGVFITIPDDLYGKVRAYAEEKNLTIQEAVLALVRKGLEAEVSR